MDAVEELITRQVIGAHLLGAVVAGLSMVLALLLPSPLYVAGTACALLGPLHFLRGRRCERAVAALRPGRDRARADGATPGGAAPS